MNYGGRSFAAGGAMPMEQLTEFNEGGRHEENSLGGIPQGMNPEGQMNLVEEGETKFDAENYIFSDTLKVDKELADAFNLDPKMVGKTFADASKIAGRKKSKREGDAIEEAANNADLENLMEAQEAFKQARIEEKLQEIAELDPNALPALMGQGQPQGGPQGDPAMGGQMQEAPMDEQAMMEQQMMAEQQGGGGQPSPEEMAMMQQQQNQMMGQQEGMMRSGGKLPKEVLKARVQSHMSPAQADAYVKSYGNGGYTNRLYKLGGFGDPPYSTDPTADNYKPTDKYGQTNSPKTKEADDFINFGKPELDVDGTRFTSGPLTKEQTTDINRIADGLIDNYHITSPYLIQDESEIIIPTFKNAGKYPMTEDGYVGRGAYEMPDEARDAHRAKARLKTLKTLADQEAFKNNIFLEIMTDSKRNGGYTRSYAPGGFMGMNMANAGMMTPDPCGTPENPCPGKETEFTTSKIDRMGDQSNQDQSSTVGGLKFSPNLSSTEEAGFADDKVMQELRQSMLSQYGAAATDSDPAYGTEVGTTLIENTPPVKSNDFNVPQTTSNSNLNPPTRGTYKPITQANKHKPFSYHIGQHFKGRTQKQRVKPPGIFSGRKRRGLEFGGDLMQPMNQMRRGGKMCYGCGGAMHAYGGRMNGMNQMATGGEIVAGIGSGSYGAMEGLLNTLTFGATSGILEEGYEALQEIGPMKGEDNIGDAIRGGANIAGATTGAILTGGAASGSAVAEGSSGAGNLLGAVGKETGNETLGKVGQGVEGAGQIAGMIVGGGGAGSAAGSAVGAGAGTLGAGAKAASAADAATKASKAAKFAKVGEIASNKAVQAGTDMATAAIGSAEEKAEAERLAEAERMRVEREMMMTNDPTSLYYNPTTELPPLTLGQGGYIGTRSYGKGGGLWANIHNKRKRIAAGSNERMRKPGSKGAPTAEALKNSQNALGGRLYSLGGFKEIDPELETNPETDEFNNMYPDISEALKQTPLQQAALYAPIAKNLYDATLAKSDDYTPDFVPAEFVQLDSAQAIQQAKQSNAGIVNAAKAKGFNNPSVMLALNQQLQGNVANVQAQYDQVNAKFKQAKLDKDNVQKRELSKIKEELAMRLKEAKDLSFNEGLKQAKQIAENKTANELAALYATMGAPDMGKNFMGNKKMTKAQLDKAIKKLEKERKKLENN